MKSSFLQKYEQKIVEISALTTQGRNPDNFLFVFWEKRWLHRFILKLSDLYETLKNPKVLIRYEKDFTLGLKNSKYSTVLQDARPMSKWTS